MPERLTDEQLREIGARANAATPGPWRLWDREIAPRRITDGSGDISALLDTSEDAEGFNREADAYFVAHARADIPLLLAEIRALREEVQLAQEHYGLPTKEQRPYPPPNLLENAS